MLSTQYITLPSSHITAISDWRIFTMEGIQRRYELPMSIQFAGNKIMAVAF